MDLPSDAVLVLIDFQRGFENEAYGEWSNPDVAYIASELLAAWREDDRPLVHVRHASPESGSPLQPDLPGFDWLAPVEPREGEYTIEKTVNGAFLGTPLDEWLQDHGYDTLVVCGLTTEHCVSTTVRMAENRGYEVYLVADGTSTFETRTPAGDRIDAETSHQVALAHLDGEFATVVNAADVLAKV